jgi:hypothetical protein
MAAAAAWAFAAVKGAVTAYKAWAATHAIAAAVVKIAASAVISKAFTAKARLQSSGTQLSFQASTTQPIPYAFGQTAIAGNLVFQYPSGPKNKHLNMFPVLSGAGPIESIVSFSMNTQPITWNNSTGKPTNSSSYQNRLWLKTALGVLGAAAITQPTQPASDSALPQWSSAHKLSGYAHAWLDVEYDPAVAGLGSLQPQFVIKGVKAYDPRLDSTYPGGSGSCRINDRSTWVWSENPWVLAITWCLGWHANGKRVGGVGIPATMIDMPAMVEAANVADLNGWKAGGVVTSSDSKWGVLQLLAQAGGGVVMQTGALVSCRVFAPRVSLDTVSVDDLAGGGTIPATKSRRDRINSVIPSYRSSQHNWAMVPAAAVTVSAYVTYDGGLRQRAETYELVQNAQQAAQLAAYELVNGREIGPIALPLKPRFLGYKPGDALTLNLPEKGLNNQLAIITGRSLDFQTGTVTLTFDTETTAKHDFALGRTANPPPITGLTKPDFATVPQPAAGQWTATLGTDTGGLPSITVAGDCSDYAFCSEIIIEFRKDATGPWQMWGSLPRTATTTTITGLAGGASYEVGVSYRSMYGVGPRRVLSAVVTGTASIGVSDDTNAVGGVPASTVLTGISNNAAAIAAEVVNRTNAILSEASARTAEVSATANTLRSEFSSLSASASSIGAYDAAKAYSAGNVVKYAGHLYRALGATTGNVPTNAAHWADIGTYNDLGDALGDFAGRINVTEQRITNAEGVASSQSSQIASVSAQLANKADTAALTALTSTVTSQGSAITAQSGRIDSVESTVAGKADSSALSALTSTVSSQGSAITAQSGRIDSVESSVSGLSGTVGGQASAIGSLNSRVSSTESGISALSSAVTAVNAELDEINGQGLLSMEVRAGSGDVSVQIVLRARASTASAWVDVGTVWEAGFTGGVPFSRETHIANQFRIIGSGGVPVIPFEVDVPNNRINMTNVYVQKLFADAVQTDNLVSNAALQTAVYTIGQFTGSGVSNKIDVLDVNVSVPVAGTLLVQPTLNQELTAYDSSPCVWSAEILVDGVSQFYSDSVTFQALLSPSAAAYVTAGTHNVKVRWSANRYRPGTAFQEDVVLKNSICVITLLKKTT